MQKSTEVLYIIREVTQIYHLCAKNKILDIMHRR